MAKNKENINIKILKTKIPLPVDTLPPVPKHLTTAKIHDSGGIRKTLNAIENQPGPSQCSKTEKKTVTLKSTPLRNVLRRVKRQDALCNFNIFNDTPIVKRPEPEVTADLTASYEVSRRKSKTPIPKPSAIEVSQIRNINTSLRRPNSRKLQGLAEEGKKIEEDKAKFQLSFTQRFEEYMISPTPITVGYIKCLDCKNDIFKHLLMKETYFIRTKSQTTKINKACIVNWLVKVNGPSGDPAIIQCACWYIEEIMFRENIPFEKLQLFTSACYWIAQKLYHSGATAKKIAERSNNAFTNHELIHCEVKVLRALDFPPQPVVPHDFIAYLASFCCKAKPGIIELAANFFVTTSLVFTPSALLDRPSVVAAAAVENALLCFNMISTLKKLHLCPLYRTARIKAINFKCLCAAQRKAVIKISQPNYVYGAPFDYFDAPPLFIARRIVKGINKNF